MAISANLPLSQRVRLETSQLNTPAASSLPPDTRPTPHAADGFVRSEAPPQTFIHPDSTGKIKHLALQLDNSVTPTIRLQVFDTWAKVFKAVDPDVKFTLTFENKEDVKAVKQMITDLGIKNPERFNAVVVDDLNITMWARDQMIGLGNVGGGNTILGQTTMRPHGDDEKLVPRIAAANPELRFDPDKRFQTDGGDEVSNPTTTFLGYNSLALTAQRLYNAAQPNGASFNTIPNQAEWLDQAKSAFAEKYGHKIVVVGQDDPNTPEVERPATFHIDMGMTPVDRDKILVGDPSLALEAINKMTPAERADHNQRLNAVLGLPADHDSMGDLVQENTVKTPDLQHQFDYNAQHVASEGLAVKRLPYLQGPPGMTWVTYNNCLMESYKREDGSQVRRVFLPEYNLPILDKMAEDTYKSLGFEVVPLNLPALTAWRGAIRCISNVFDKEVQA